MSLEAFTICHLCGQKHESIILAPGEKALCVRCDTVLAEGSRARPDTTLVFALTGLAFALPAALLPLAGADKLGVDRVSHLFTGVGCLWDLGMRPLAGLVFLCSWMFPVMLFGIWAILHGTARLGWPMSESPILIGAARRLEHWALPDVQVLAVLVALIKLGSLVHITIGSGFWCYVAMTLSLLMAQGSFSRAPIGPKVAPVRAKANPS